MVDHLLFACDVAQHDVIGQPEHAAHVRGLDTDEVVGAGVRLEDVVEHAGVVEVFRDGERLVRGGTLLFAEVRLAVEENGNSERTFRRF